MPANETVTVEWKVKLQELTSALTKAGGLTEGEAKRMVIGLDKQIQGAKKAAQDMAKAQAVASKGADDLKKGLASAGKLASSFGGQLGAVGATANSAGSALAELGGPVLGSVGAAAGIAVGVVGALAYAIVQGAEAVNAYVDAADPLIKRLGEISGTEPLPASTTAALDEYRQSSLGLEAATDRLHVVTAGFVAELAGPALDALTGFVGELDGFIETNGPLAIKIFHDLEGVARVVEAVLSGGGTEVLRYGAGLAGLEAAGHAAAAGLTDTANAAKLANDNLSAGEKIIDIQTDAMLAMTGASSGMIAAQKAVDANNDALNTYMATLDLSIPASKALADVAAHSVEVRNQQIVADAQATDSATAHAAAEQRLAAALATSAAAEKTKTAAINDMLAAEAKQRDGAAQLAQITRDASSDQLDAEGKITAGYNAQLDQIGQVADATDNQAAGEAALAATTDRYQRDITQSRWDAAEAGMAAEDEYLSKAQKNLNALSEAFSDASTIWQSGLSPALDALGTILDNSAQAASDVANGYRDAADVAQEAYDSARQDYLANAGDMSAADQAAAQSKIDLLGRVAGARDADADAAEEAAAQAAQKAFNAQKAAGIASAAVQAAVNVGALIPAFAFLGPFAPVAAGLVAAGTFATEVAAIESAPAPTYHVGGMVSRLAPDEVPVVARDGEAFLTPLGVQNVGGPDGVRAANAGTNRADTDGTVEVHMDRRMVGRAVARVVRKSGGRKKRIGVAPTYRR